MIRDINNEIPSQDQSMPAIPKVVDYIETEGGLFCSLYSDKTFQVDWSMGEDPDFSAESASAIPHWRICKKQDGRQLQVKKNNNY